MEEKCWSTSKMWASVIALLLTLLIVDQANCQTTVDLNGGGCNNIEGYLLSTQDEILTISARVQTNAPGTMSTCDVTVRALNGRRIEYVIETIIFHECGPKITIYDSQSGDFDPLYELTCKDNNRRIKGKSPYNILRLRLVKPVPESRFFEFQMRMSDDRGEPLDFIKTKSDYVGESIEPGIIAGIGIAGAIVIIALILLAIYLCVRARQTTLKEAEHGTEMGESSIYTSGNSQVLFASGATRYPKGKYGSMEDIRSSASSQEKTNGAYSNAAYSKGPGEKGSERSASIGRSRGKAGFANDAFYQDSSDMGYQGREEEAGHLSRGGEGRRSRREEYEEKKPMKSALKKRDPEETKNGILKTRTHSPSRSYASSTEGSLDTNAIIYGYTHSKTDHPNVHHKPVLERRRSRSGTRSHRSGSSAGKSPSRRSQSADKKKPKDTGRMYGDVYFEQPRRSTSAGRSRTRSGSYRSKRSDRTSDSVDSESSATTTSYSRKVSMNPGGKRVHIKGEETDI